MSNIAIKAENVSKVYQLGQFSTGTLSRDLERWWAGMRGKEDPFLKIGEINDRTTKGGSNIVWSLKDINFEIEQGDAVGIIGRNGAGKSTLLKILSKVTSPTTGRISGKGRIASLLEVGTGFHPELTGRENIFLNGAILGMRKTEIRRKFDEIVDFAGIERYIDTPVKRYSSGMYVRLAFAVAAHLESEILIVDEVLAVGDAEFQKKCLGKMGEVSKGEGRTVLFVSHNIASIKALCTQGIFLKNGMLEYAGSIEESILQYQESLRTGLDGMMRTNYYAVKDETKAAQILSIKVTDESGNENLEFDIWDKIFIEYEFIVNKMGLINLTPIINVDKDGIELFWSFASDTNKDILNEWQCGKYLYKLQLPNPLKKGIYNITVKLGKLRIGDIDVIHNAVQVVVDEFSFDPTNVSYASVRGGIIPAVLDWQQIPLS